MAWWAVFDRVAMVSQMASLIQWELKIQSLFYRNLAISHVQIGLQALHNGDVHIAG